MKQKVADSEKSVDPVFRITSGPTSLEKDESDSSLDAKEGKKFFAIKIVFSIFQNLLLFINSK